LLVGAEAGFAFTPRPGEEDIEAVRKRVNEGDPSVVPVLKQWLRDESSKGPVGAGSIKLLLAIWGVGEFGLDSQGATLSGLYHDATAQTRVREAVVSAAARIGTSGARRLLVEGMNDTTLARHRRYEAAATLVEMGDEAAREFLIDGYKAYLVEITTKHSWDQSVRDAIEHLTDAKLMERLEALKPKQTDQRAKNNITTLLNVMRISALDTAELLKLAEETDWGRGMYKRYEAIAALGRKGSMDDVPRLERLQPWANGEGATSGIQQNFVREYRDRAIGSIRRRNWQALAGRPVTTRPATTQGH